MSIKNISGNISGKIYLVKLNYIFASYFNQIQELNWLDILNSILNHIFEGSNLILIKAFLFTPSNNVSGHH